MKKLLAVLLALLTLLSFAACGNGSDTESESDTETNVGTESESETETETETDPESESESEPETETNVPPVDNSFVERNETVYVNGANALNIRATNTLDDNNIVGALKEGDSVKRVGYNETWSKIVYNGKEYYASSKYLSTKAPVAFDDVNETVYVKVENTVTVRSKAWADSEALAYLPNGTAVIRTGVAKEADEFGSYWSRIIYTDEKGNAKDGYINSRFLSSETPLAFTEVNETVIISNCETLNLRAEASVNGKTLASPKSGTELQRIGLATAADADGIVWSMLMHEGNVCYASSAYLAVKADAKTFAASGMNITLTEDFEQGSQDGYTAAFASEDMFVGAQKVPFESLAGTALSSSSTTVDYANAIITGSQLNSTVSTANGLTSFSYTVSVSDIHSTIFATVYKSKDAFWVIQYITLSEAYPALSASILGYAGTVTFD